MNKADFERAVRKALQEVPLETRKQWDETKLFIWWERAKREDSYLTWERCKGDIWQHVKSICKDLIGDKAIW